MKVRPGNAQWESLYNRWLHNGKPRFFGHLDQSWMMLRDNNQLVFLATNVSQAGINNPSGVHL